MKTNHILLLLSFLLFQSIHLLAQENYLEQYIEEGWSNNLNLIKEQIERNQQQAKVDEAYGSFLPNVSFKADYLLAAGGRDIAFPIGDIINPVYGTLNQVTGENRFPTDLENVNEQFLPNNFHDTRIVINQPLFNSSIYFNHKAQEQLLSVQDAKIAAYKVELKKEIKQSYYNYLKTARVLEIYDSTEVLLKELLRTNKKLVKYDKATEDVIYSVEYELQKLESERANILQQRVLAQTYFNTLLNRALNATIEEDRSINVQNIQTFDPKTLLASALQARPEIKQIERGILAQQVVEELQQRSNLPTLGLQVQAGFQGFGYTFEDQAYATLGFGLQWNIFEGKQKQHRLQQSQLETQKLRQDLAVVKQQIELQIREAWYGVQAAKQQLQAEKAALTSAEKSFRIIQKRYAADQAILVEYLDARTKMTNARITVSVSEYDLLIQQAMLERSLAL
ncbi:MAG: TolC family protein [Bacteroidota bacterium]